MHLFYLIKSSISLRTNDKSEYIKFVVLSVNTIILYSFHELRAHLHGKFLKFTLMLSLLRT